MNNAGVSAVGACFAGILCAALILHKLNVLIEAVRGLHKQASLCHSSLKDISDTLYALEKVATRARE